MFKRPSFINHLIKRSPAARELSVFLALLALTVVMTWPWVTHLRDATHDRLDSYAHAYFLWWGYHQTFNDPVHLFNANIFYPYTESFAFGENDYGISLILFPLFAFGVRPLTAHGVATLLGFAFSGYGMFRLSRTLSGSNSAAAIAAIVFAFIPYRFGQLDRLPLVFAGWIPLLLEALILFARERSWKRAAWLGLTFFMDALTSLTWLVLTTVPLLLSGVLLVRDRRLWTVKDFWQRAGLALSVSALALLPFLLPFYRVTRLYGFVRERTEVGEYSVRLINWLTTNDQHKLWRSLGAITNTTSELALFPGLLPVMLAAIAVFAMIWVATRQRADRVSAAVNRELFGHAFIWLSVGFAGSFGLNFFFHRLLYELIPVFRSVRVVARWSMICYVGLAILAGFGARALLDVVARQRPRWQYNLMGALLICAVLFEQRVAPMNLLRGEPDPDQLTLRLKQTPMSGGIVDLPAGRAGTGNQRYMLRAADHGKPIVNATDSFRPPLALEVEGVSELRPIPDRFLDLLDSIPVSYVVVHTSFLSVPNRLAIEEVLARGIAAGRLRFVHRYDYRDGEGVDGFNDLYAMIKTEPLAISEGTPPPRVSYAEYAPRWQSLPPDFRDSGYFIYRLYRVALRRRPQLAEFATDAMAITKFKKDERLDDTGKNEFVSSWLGRADIRAQYESRSNAQYVSQLLANAGIKFRERDDLIRSLNEGAETRSQVFRKIADDETFLLQEFDSAFVVLNYFAYLRRDPDQSGYDYWLTKLDGSAEYGNISKSFINSYEHVTQGP